MSRDPHIRRALAVGSSELFAALERSTPSKNAPELRGKLLRYLIRMSSRPTPYGLFAGVALGRWEHTTNLSLGSDAPRTRTRPDMAWLMGFVLKLEANPEIRKHLSFVANPAAFIRAGRVFLAERSPAGEAGSAPTVSVRATGVVQRALAAARSLVPYDQLVSELLSFSGATPEKVAGLIDQLWQQTVLLTDLRPPLTVDNPARYVARCLASIPEAREALAQLSSAIEAAGAWDRLPPEEGAQAYCELETNLHSIYAPESGQKPSLQVDMSLPLSSHQVSEDVSAEIARAGELLLRFSPLPRGLPHLDTYRRAFESRYGPGREVPLLEMLDPNFGLGSPASHRHGGGGVEPERVAIRQRTLQELAIRALRDRRPIVELDEQTISKLQTSSPSPQTAPPSIDLSVFVVARSAEALDAGEYLVILGPNLGATAAGRNLGRFADLLGTEATAALRRTARAEEAHYPGKVHAELVYLPHHVRSANVAIRPLVRDYEIALGTSANVSPDKMIPLNELVVGVHGNRFYVRWPTKDFEIVVHSGHMLNNLQAPEACRFLTDITHEGRTQLSSFDWGSAASLPFLPRVQTGKLVLSLAQWRIDSAMSAQELPSHSKKAFRQRLKDWRDRWQVPRRVYLSFGDNRLLLDLYDPTHVEELRTEVRRLQEESCLLLQEALPDPAHAWAPGKDGHFLTEFMVPLVLGDAPEPTSDHNGRGSDRRSPSVAAVSPETRLRPPGSEWLFTKLHYPPMFEEDLISGPVRTFCNFVMSAGLAEDWFFIRYSDPDRHLRLRFRGDPQRLLSRLVPQLCEWARELIDVEVCTKFSFDTYEREVERYGGPEGIVLTESLFGVDSRAVTELLNLNQQRVLGLDRTTLTVLSIDDLLAGVGLGELERLRWYKERVTERHKTGPEYRERKGTLRALLGNPNYLSRQPGGEATARVFAARRKELAPVARKLKDLSDKHMLGQPMSILCQSYVHLHCNRLLETGWSLEEQALGLLLRTREGLAHAPVRSRE